MRLYTYLYTVTTRMIPALRWAAMRATQLLSSGTSSGIVFVLRQPPPWLTGRLKSFFNKKFYLLLSLLFSPRPPQMEGELVNIYSCYSLISEVFLQHL